MLLSDCCKSHDSFDTAGEGIGRDCAGFGEAMREAGHGPFFVQQFPVGAIDEFNDEQADGVAADINDGEALAGEK